MSAASEVYKGQINKNFTKKKKEREIDGYWNILVVDDEEEVNSIPCLLSTSPGPRDVPELLMPSPAGKKKKKNEYTQKE